MKRDVIIPRDEAHWLEMRRQDLTSSDIAELAGLEGSIFALWHEKHRGVVRVFEETEEMLWGKRLEKPIAEGIAEDQGFEVVPMKEYIRLPEYRLASSFDYREVNRAFVFEIKDVGSFAFREGFTESDEFGIECPPRIEAQVANEMLVGDFVEARIGVLVGRRGRVVIRPRYDDISAGILERASAFWKMPEPQPDFHRDASFIARELFGYSQEGTAVNADAETVSLFRQYAGFRAEAKAADDNADAAKAKILMRIGNAERVLHPEWSLSTKMVKATHVSYERAAYRGFKLTEKGAKK